MHKPLHPAALAIALFACSSDGPCVSPPCPIPLALTIAVTSSATGASVPGALVNVAGVELSDSISCASSCSIPGPAGTYNLTVSAPGFVTVLRSVTVQGISPSACGCGTVSEQHVAVALVASQ